MKSTSGTVIIDSGTGSITRRKGLTVTSASSHIYAHQYMLDPNPFDVETFPMSNQLQVVILTYTSFDPDTYERDVITLGTFYE